MFPCLNEEAVHVSYPGYKWRQYVGLEVQSTTSCPYGISNDNHNVNQVGFSRIWIAMFLFQMQVSQIPPIKRGNPLNKVSRIWTTVCGRRYSGKSFELEFPEFYDWFAEFWECSGNFRNSNSCIRPLPEICQIWRFILFYFLFQNRRNTEFFLKFPTRNQTIQEGHAFIEKEVGIEQF